MVHVDLLTAAAAPAAAARARPIRALLGDSAWAGGEAAPLLQPASAAERPAKDDERAPLAVDGEGSTSAGRCEEAAPPPPPPDGSGDDACVPPSTDGRRSAVQPPPDAAAAAGAAAPPGASAAAAASVPVEDGSAGDSWREELVAVPAPMRRLSQQQQQRRRGGGGGGDSAAGLPGGEASAAPPSSVSALIDAAEAGVSERAAADAGAARLLGVGAAALAEARSQAAVAPGAFTVLARCSRPVLLRPPPPSLEEEEGGQRPAPGLLAGAWRLATWPARTAWRLATWPARAAWLVVRDFLGLVGAVAPAEAGQGGLAAGRHRRHAPPPRTAPDLRVDLE